MDPSDEVCKSLIKWLQTIVPTRSRTNSEVSDGVAMLNALVQIAPEHFGKLEPKIKCDVAPNWRLKVSNLKKINESVIEYYQDFLSLQVSDVGRPDVVKLGETASLTEIGKLLRLILGCAVHCDRKQEYITQIMALEESVQQSIMLAIQQLEEVTVGPGRSSLSLPSLDSDSRVVRLISELHVANETKEALAQQCHNLEHQVQALHDEKQALLSENQSLSVLLREKENVDNIRNPDTRRQIDLLKDELYKVENVRDDYRAKIMEQEKVILTLQEKIGELQQAAEVTARLKDELDALSESADKVQALEHAVASYKKKLEDYGDIKKQLKHLEEKNVEYLQQNLKYEEELKKNNVWKNQCDIFKAQSGNLQQKLDEEIQKGDKLIVLNKNLESKLEALQGERDRLIKERDSLREENEELRLGTSKGEGGAAMAQELAPTEIKERLRFLERENKALRANSQEAEAKQVLLDDALSRLEKLTEQNRTSNQRILELETQIEDCSKAQTAEQGSQNSDGAVKEYKQKVANLTETLGAKEAELQSLQAKYNRSVEKAKEVALNLEHKTNGSIDTSIRHSNMKEIEEKLMTSAFYRLALGCHRESVDERLAHLTHGQGQFLARQRQAVPRKPMTPYKSK